VSTPRRKPTHNRFLHAGRRLPHNRGISGSKMCVPTACDMSKKALGDGRRRVIREHEEDGE